MAMADRLEMEQGQKEQGPQLRVKLRPTRYRLHLLRVGADNRLIKLAPCVIRRFRNCDSHRFCAHLAVTASLRSPA